MSSYSVFVGIDWGSEKHQVCVVDPSGAVQGQRAFNHSGDGLGELAQWLTSFESEAARIAIAIEVPRGPIVETLLERAMAVFALNPKQTDRFRDRFSPSGAKDDRRDARVLADSLRTDMSVFRQLKAEDPKTIRIREWSRMTEEIAKEEVRLTNQFREHLWRYFPQMLDVSSDLALEWVIEVWRIIPSPAHAKKMKPSRIARVLRDHRITRITADEILTIARQKPVVVTEGTTDAVVEHIEMLVSRLQLVIKQHKAARKRLEELCASLGDAPGQESEQRDVEILHSLPGVGPIVLATLLAEAREPLRRRDYHALRVLFGVAPVTKQSGKMRVVSMRMACNIRLRDAAFYWAQTAAVFDPASKARYAQLRARGHSRPRALRTIADRLLKVACCMLTNGQPYDPNRALPSSDLSVARASIVRPGREDRMCSARPTRKSQRGLGEAPSGTPKKHLAEV